MKERKSYPPVSPARRVGLIVLAITCGGLLVISMVLAQSAANFSTSYKSGTPLIDSNDVVTYTIAAINTGGPVTDVLLSDPVPNGSVFIPGSCIYWRPGDSPQACGPPPDLWQEDFVADESIMTTFAVRVEDRTMGWPLVNCATLRWDENEKEMCTTATVRALVYLPFVARNFVTAPDLVVSDVIATGSEVEVTITNQGNAPVEGSFWVDLYVNPNPIPEAVNQVWQDLCDEGIVWGVREPLEVGESLTLRLDSPYYSEEYSYFTGGLTAEDQVYVQVDSAFIGRGYGGVLEDHEILGGDYNNIWPTYDPGALSTTTISHAVEQLQDQMPPRP